MRIALRLALLLILLGGAVQVAAPRRAQATPAPLVPLPPGCVQPAPLPHGALWMHCIPAGWTGDLVIYAHGYVANVPANPLDFYNLTFAGVSLPALVQGQGSAFATTSYRRNGLAALEGIDDIRELIAAFPAAAGRAPRRVYVIGVSEGGLVATLLAERSPELISGALATCGPIGDFKRQTEYFGDFRVLFDYFYPGVLPTSPISIPGTLMTDWASPSSTYQLSVTNALHANLITASQLISTTHAAVDRNNLATIVTTTLDVLWYNVFATNDAIQKLGGNPYGNSTRVYTGSFNDTQLNTQIQRFTASPIALAHLAGYETTGNLRAPLVTMHTTDDPVIPYWHEDLYREKVPLALRRNLRQIEVFSYGHCAFSQFDALSAFNQLVDAVNNRYAVYLPLVRRP
jgi:pimeloyl-ACP methyl ester carboxylesterase